MDTSFWLALQLPRDPHHKEAASLINAVDDASLVTSNHVRGETWTFLRRKAWHGAAVTFLDSLDQTERVRVDRVSPELEDSALQWLRRHDERPYSFVDATSFALMRSLRITDAFVFDRDFAVAGFVQLRP